MKIFKKGRVIPFDCQSCECRFVVGFRQIRDANGNYYARCPECGAECHTDMSDLARYEEEVRKKKCSDS